MLGVVRGVGVLLSAADTLAGGRPGNKQRHARRTLEVCSHALWDWGRELPSSAGGEGSPPAGVAGGASLRRGRSSRAGRGRSTHAGPGQGGHSLRCRRVNGPVGLRAGDGDGGDRERQAVLVGLGEEFRFGFRSHGRHRGFQAGGNQDLIRLLQSPHAAVGRKECWGVGVEAGRPGGGMEDGSSGRGGGSDNGRRRQI